MVNFQDGKLTNDSQCRNQTVLKYLRKNQFGKTGFTTTFTNQNRYHRFIQSANYSRLVDLSGMQVDKTSHSPTLFTRDGDSVTDIIDQSDSHSSARYLPSSQPISLCEAMADNAADCNSGLQLQHKLFFGRKKNVFDENRKVLDSEGHSEKAFPLSTSFRSDLQEKTISALILVGGELRFRRMRRDHTPEKDFVSFSNSVMLCGKNNSALFGACVATDYWKLKMSVTAENVFAGLQFGVNISKKDAYNQTIMSDSSSFVQVSIFSEAVAAMSGLGLGRLTLGVASMMIAVKPTFSELDFSNRIVSVSGPILIYSGGDDAQTGVPMLSRSVALNLQQGNSVCPSGYILVPDHDGEEVGLASCSLCGEGTYSIDPLAHASDTSDETPSCVACPSGGDCSVGTHVFFAVGDWVVRGGIYILVSCPPGHQLINSTSGTSTGTFSNRDQQCRACLQGEYIIDPDTNECNPCPPGRAGFVMNQTETHNFQQ